MNEAFDANMCLSIDARDALAAVDGSPDADALANHEADLIRRSAHDPGAFAHLYRLHCKPIANYLQRRTLDPHIIEDLLSEVFLRALRGLPRWTGAKRGVPLRFWLLRIATNVVHRWLRQEAKQRRRRDRDRPSATSAAQPSVPNDELASALRSLPVDWQDVLVLHHVEGLDMAQVAIVLDCRVGTVKSRLFRARAALRARLEHADRKERT